MTLSLRSRAGFTLIELAVVLFILSAAIAILLPRLPGLDTGRKNAALVCDPQPPVFDDGPADLVFCESTYGGREHKGLGDTQSELEAILFKESGRLFSPSAILFALVFTLLSPEYLRRSLTIGTFRFHSVEQDTALPTVVARSWFVAAMTRASV